MKNSTSAIKIVPVHTSAINSRIVQEQELKNAVFCILIMKLIIIRIISSIYRGGNFAMIIRLYPLISIANNISKQNIRE